MKTEKTMLQELEDINKEIEKRKNKIAVPNKSIHNILIKTDFKIWVLEIKKEQLEKDIKRFEEGINNTHLNYVIKGDGELIFKFKQLLIEEILGVKK